MTIKLGLCKPPEAIYLYVKASKEKNYLWYQFDVDKEQEIPVHDRALCGFLKEIRLTTKEFKGKEAIKLDVVISADETYIIRTGIETNFAKTFLTNAIAIHPEKPVIISVVPGEENVVFCRIFDAETKSRFKVEYDRNADWMDLIKRLQSRLGQMPSIVPQRQQQEYEQPVIEDNADKPIWEQEPVIDRSILIAEINSIVSRKQISGDKFGKFLQLAGLESIEGASDGQLSKFLQRLKEWANRQQVGV